jgi:RNA polymerase sigma-70 factor (ECF subfamily)
VSNDDQPSADFDERSISSLLPAARAGSVQATNELFGQLHSYLAWVAHREFDARFQNKIGESDIVQQSYLRAVERFGDFQGDDERQFRAWVREILTNELRQVRRSLRAGKRDWRRERGAAREPGEATRGSAEFVDNLPTPGTQALADEQSAGLRAALCRMSEEHRCVIELRTWQHLSFGEIAARMGRSENAVTKLWFRALLRLQDELERDDESA